MDPARLNPEGGAISIGHPVGASGARLVLHLLHALKRKGGGQGVATLCIGGGQGGAMLVARARGGRCGMSKHWHLDYHTDHALLTLDVAGQSANVLSQEVLAGTGPASGTNSEDKPLQGLIIRSGKASGFIAGADVREFERITRLRCAPPNSRSSASRSVRGSRACRFRRWP